MEKIKLRQAVIVEGKYDRVKVSALIDGLIIQTDGFRIYKDKQKIAMIRAVALRQGVVILTDSDRAGFQIRGFLHSIAAGAEVTNLYIPQISGKERRKAGPGAEGLLGVEGIDVQTLQTLFQKAGLLDDTPSPSERPITRMDFYGDGLMGGADASKRRAALLKHLGLPGYLTTNSLLEVINSLMTYEEYRAFCKNL